MKRKIMFVVNTDSFFMSHRMPIALGALREGFEVHVACAQSSCTNVLQAQGVIVHPLNLDRRSAGPISNGRTFFQILRLFMSVKPHLVHLVTIKPVLMGGLAARLANVPGVVAAISGLGVIFIARGVKARFRRWLVARLYRFSLGHPNMKVVFQNEEDRACLVSISGLAIGRTVWVRGSGVNLDEYVVSPIPEGVPVVVFAARFLVDKGVREFVEAARILRDWGTTARFVLVGKPDPGNPNTIHEHELARWVDEKVVEWWGYRHDMPMVLGSCNIFVLPSFYGEGLPKVLIEASACGRVVVTTDHPGCRDAIEPNKTGLLVPPRDVEALAKAINKLLVDRSLCEEMGHAGRKFAERVFDVKQVVERHMCIYNELLQKAF